MTRRALTVSILAAIFLLAGASAQAEAGQYTVLKCHIFSRSSSEVAIAENGPYDSADACAGADQRFEVSVSGFGLPGQAGSITVTAPSNTKIVGVVVDANLRRDNHHLAQLAAVNYAGTARVLANGSDTASGFEQYHFDGLSDLRFVAQLICSDPGGCPNSTQAHAYVKNIAVILEDVAQPGVTTLYGNLFDGGWVRGRREFQAQAADLGAGVAAAWASVNGTEISRVQSQCTEILGSGLAARLTPCTAAPASADFGTVSVDTAQGPFVDGQNEVEVCVTDFAANGPICRPGSVDVDNRPPELFFVARQNPKDPELIQVLVSDPHSGIDPRSAQIAFRQVGASEWIDIPTHLATGALVARVDSGAMAPGDYEFNVAAADAAGNKASTGLRADGEPMVLTFPLRAPVQLVSRIGSSGSSRATIDYRDASVVRGRLLDRTGSPISSGEIVVTESFGSGALIDRRVRTVTIDENGRWKSAIPAGPSRTVEVAYGGSLQYQPVVDASGELRVRSRASFTTSSDRVREGRVVEFAGKVGHFGARIPSAGKLVELQVRERGGRWNTVGQAFHTDSSGRFDFRYRFGRFYERNARFVFRVKVAREEGWPYRAPGRSRARTVIVVANR